MLDTSDYPPDPSETLELGRLGRTLDEHLAVVSDYHQRIRQVVADGLVHDPGALAELADQKELCDFTGAVRNDALRQAGLDVRVQS
jgi:hypothetical protein